MLQYRNMACNVKFINLVKKHTINTFKVYFYNFWLFFKHALQLTVIKGTQGGFWYFLWLLPGRASNPVCWYRIPDSYPTTWPPWLPIPIGWKIGGMSDIHRERTVVIVKLWTRELFLNSSWRLPLKLSKSCKFLH